MLPTPQALEQAFLEDIVGHPDDPSLWLILADWLEDQGDARAELMRLTWQLQYEATHPDFPARQERLQELLADGMIPVRPRRTLDGIDYVWIPPGSFVMGSPDTELGRRGDERQHAVTLTRGFWLGVYPITQAQWSAVMGSNPSNFARTAAGRNKVAQLGDAEIDQLPVESISWEMAQAFCARWGGGVCLPTEAQWEYACRAGTTTPCHFGTILDGRQGNCDGTNPYGTEVEGPSLGRTSPVGAYPPNAWGLYDMHGNVLEWCQDAYREDYRTLSAHDPLFEQADAPERILRGGTWRSLAFGCRSAHRTRYPAGSAYINIGLRVCYRHDPE
jgi:uncharacterized protein (TIGR02996 family)